MSEKLKYGTPEYKEAKAQIDSLLKQAYNAISDAEAIADATGIGFDWELAYGMGGYYEPNEENRCGDNNDEGWQASSRSC